jgi:alkyldihydroxyacetonephosphate synthase
MTTERGLSFWGWGYSDKFADKESRQGYSTALSAVLGCAPFELREPPSIDSIALREPRVAIPTGLSDYCYANAFERLSHSYGKAYPDIVRGFHGDYPNPPDLVAHPRTEEEVVAVLKWAEQEAVAVIPFGGGTSVVGGVEGKIGNGYKGFLSLDMRALNKVLEIDKESQAALIEAGATGPVLEQQLAKHDMTLRHYPQSFEFSTLGGWVATRAGGHFATLYTHIDDLVQSIRMVGPRGVWESRRLPGSGAGPSPDRLLLGSEGILGVITRAWMRIRKRPRFRVSTSVKFNNYKQAVAATREIAQAGLYPSNCRLLDAGEAQLHRVSMDGTHILLLGFENADHPVSVPMFRAIEIAQAHGGESGEIKESESGATQDREAQSKNWREAFINAPYLLNTLVSMGVIADTFETSITWQGFEKLHSEVLAAGTKAMKELCGGGFMTCRFTHVYPDGPAPYYTFIAPGRFGEEIAQWTVIKKAVSDALIANGATITHHHAVGRSHKPWYDKQRPDLFAAALKAAKKELDPGSIMNPGVLI